MTRRRRWLWGGMAACWVALSAWLGSTLLAAPGVVVTRSGQRYEGDVTERDAEVVIDIHGIKTIIARENVQSIDYRSEDFDQRFEERRAKLEPRDIAGRIELANFALENQKYAKAREVLAEAQAIDPNSREVYDMIELVRAQERLARARGPATRPAQVGPGEGAEHPATQPIGRGERRLLNQQQMNAIRLRELTQNDRVRVRFDNTVDRRYATSQSKSFNEFNALGPVAKALEILEKGDPSMHADVRVLNDPQSIADYKRLQPRILNGCASTNCHGGGHAGDFLLYNPTESELVTYTNFYILSQYSKQLEDEGGGVFGGPAQRKMIERGQAERSLLTQYALPADLAEADHPDVPNYNGMFRNREDPMYRQLVTWINNLSPLRGDYGIQFEIPGARPTTQPATTQAAEEPTEQPDNAQPAEPPGP